MAPTVRFPAVLLPHLRKNLLSDHDCFSGDVEGLGPHVAAIETVLGVIGWEGPDVERDAAVTGLSWREAGALASGR